MTLLRDPFTAGLGDLQGPTHWASLLPDEARQSWAQLRVWVEDLVDRFALETRVVPPCWYRHNTLVESLSALLDLTHGPEPVDGAAGGGVGGEADPLVVAQRGQGLDQGVVPVPAGRDDAGLQGEPVDQILDPHA